jgi:hypothetical protein
MMSSDFHPNWRFSSDFVGFRTIFPEVLFYYIQLIAEGRYTDAVDDLLIKFV